MPSHLDLLAPDQAALLTKKKRFWKKTMWISLSATFLLAGLAFSGTVIAIVRAFWTLEKAGAADPEALAGEISMEILTGLWSLPPAVLAFILFLISLIRCLSLPKLPASPPVK